MYAERQGPSHTVIHAVPSRIASARSATPRNIAVTLYSSWCSVCMMMFGLFFTIAGAIMTATSYRKPSPPFDTPFFTKGDEDNPLRIVGPVFLSIGLLLLISSIVLCCIVASKRQREGERILQGNNELYAQVSSQPSYVYPQQLQAQYAPPSNFNQPNVSPYPSHQSNIPPPPLYYDSVIGAQSDNTTKVAFNEPCGNDSSTFVPSAPAFTSYQEPQGK